MNFDNTKLWGSYYWGLIHCVSVLVPENPSQTDKETFEKFINAIKYLLPCENCKKHFIINLNNFSLNSLMEKNISYSVSRDGIIIWCIKMHNIVNRMLNKFITVTENKNGINFCSLKFNEKMIIYYLKHVMKYSLNTINEIDQEIENIYNDLFNCVSHFLLYKNIDINLILKKKSVCISFKKKKDIIFIVQNL